MTALRLKVGYLLMVSCQIRMRVGGVGGHGERKVEQDEKVQRNPAINSNARFLSHDCVV